MLTPTQFVELPDSRVECSHIYIQAKKAASFYQHIATKVAKEKDDLLKTVKDLTDDKSTYQDVTKVCWFLTHYFLTNQFAGSGSPNGPGLPLEAGKEGCGVCQVKAGTRSCTDISPRARPEGRNSDTVGWPAGGAAENTVCELRAGQSVSNRT